MCGANTRGPPEDHPECAWAISLDCKLVYSMKCQEILGTLPLLSELACLRVCTPSELCTGHDLQVCCRAALLRLESCDLFD